MSKLTVQERFWVKVDKSGDCWVWTAFTHKGYGQFRDGGKVKAHRYSWALENGPIPAGMQVDHRCLNRSCVRPSHLRLVVGKENAENRSGANNGSKSGVRGVGWHPSSGKWEAKVVSHGVCYYLGHFADIEQARLAVTAKRLELFTHNELDRIA